MNAAAQPWHELPPEVAHVMRPLLPALADEIIEAVGSVPDYSRPLEGEFGVGVRAGVQAALGHLVAEIEAGGPIERADVYRQLGRGEMRAGRSLDSLLAAYRIGARVAWRQVAVAGEAAGLSPATLYRMAESIFAYIDVLSGESAEGYALEQTAIAGETELARSRLVRLLVREPAVDADEVRTAAKAAGWQLPKMLAAVAIQPASGATVRLPVGAVSERIGELICAVVPDPEAPMRRVELEQALTAAGLHAAIGTVVGWQDAGASFARARSTLALGLDATLVSAHECAGDLLLAADPALAAELASTRLAPLADLTPASRERLAGTLRAWLAEQGRLGPVAARLGIHPQTARYRISRLRELFGPVLDDPDERFWLDLALRVSGRG